jgi:hypothetical protein
MKSEQKLLTPKEVAKCLDTEFWDQYCAIKSERWSKAVTDRRDHIILRLFVTCDLRPQETFPLRANDIERERLRVDEALKQASWHAAAELGSYRPPGVHKQESAQRLAVEFGNPAAGSSAGTITGNATPYLVHSR